MKFHATPTPIVFLVSAVLALSTAEGQVTLHTDHASFLAAASGTVVEEDWSGLAPGTFLEGTTYNGITYSGSAYMLGVDNGACPPTPSPALERFVLAWLIMANNRVRPLHTRQ